MTSPIQLHTHLVNLHPNGAHSSTTRDPFYIGRSLKVFLGLNEFGSIGLDCETMSQAGY